MISSSFRDPSGRVCKDVDGTIYREVSGGYRDVLMQLLCSSLYGKLTERRWLLPFDWIGDRLIPEQVPTISYPYEWSFSMLKDAALLTLDIQLLALDCGMQLKDASAYNVQFVRGKPIFIDHLSFYPYEENKPWVAYGQFCRHFLNPLVLQSYCHPFLHHLTKDFIDGVPPGLAWGLLPLRAKLRPFVFMNVFLQALKSEPKLRIGSSIPKYKLVAVLKSLRSLVVGLKYKSGYGWKDYKKVCNYDDFSASLKACAVEDYLRQIRGKKVVDLGANVGLYSQVALDCGCSVIAVDSDPSSVELCYQSSSNGRASDDCLPLVVDLANPSPGIGWDNSERMPFTERVHGDTVLCLALIHHLAIGNNLPLGMLASFLGKLGDKLIVEWVPKEDSQVRKMLKYREDIFPNYTKEGFEEAFCEYYRILDCRWIEGTKRHVYLMEVK